MDPLVLLDRETEVWGRMYRPMDMVTAPAKMPVVLFMHGNHGTCGKNIYNNETVLDLSCEYSYTGKCPGKDCPHYPHVSAVCNMSVDFYLIF